MQRSTLFSILAAGLMFAGSAHPQWYAGAGVGQSDARLSDGAQASGRFLAQGFSSAATSLDKRDAGYRVYGGYKFRQYFAVELGYADLGRYRIHSDATSNPVGMGTLDNEIKIKGYDVGVVGVLPVNDRFSVFGRVGAFSSEAKSAVSSSGSVVLFDGDSANYKKRGTQAAFGLGAEYEIAPKVSIRGEWSRFEKVKVVDALGGDRETGISLYTVGVTYSF